MPRLLPSLLVLTAFGASAPAGDDKVFSGPQPGEKLTAFKVLGFSGPHAGKEFEAISDVKGRPALLIFVHEITRPAMQFMRPVDYYATKLAKDGLAAHIVWLSADKTKTETYLTTAQKSLGLKSPVSISLDGIEGPGNYGLNRKVALTVLVAKEGKVTANFAIVQPNETDAPKVLAAMAKLVGKTAPTLEEITKEIGGRPKAGKDGKPSPSPELATLMRRMIQKDNDEATVRKIAEEMVRWAGDDAKRRAELAEYCGRVARLGYGTEAAQAALKRLAGK
jgi:hypothetical protein